MKSDSGKEEVQSLSEGLGVVIAIVFMDGGRLFQRVGNFIGKSGWNFNDRYVWMV